LIAPAFLLTRWAGDGDLCSRAIQSILRYYPKAEIILMVDGALEDGDTLGFVEATTVVHGGSLFSAEHGGAWALRWIRAALGRSSAEIIVRIDPDSLMIRPLKRFPNADLFGTLMQHPKWGQFVQGGACGYTRAALERIERSGRLEQERMKEMNYVHPRSGRLCALDDVQVSVCAREEGLSLGAWGEVCSRWQPAYEAWRISDHRALWHPVKSL